MLSSEHAGGGRVGRITQCRFAPLPFFSEKIRCIPFVVFGICDLVNEKLVCLCLLKRQVFQLHDDRCVAILGSVSVRSLMALAADLRGK